jgi:hypothetical protein
MRNAALIKKINCTINKYASENQSFNDFWQFLFVNGDFYIIGGAIRAIYQNRKPRDIDIIVKDGADQIIKKFSNKNKIIKNYYDGYKIDLDGIIVDIWDFKNHWAFKAGILDADENNLVESCFFDFDALVYSPTTNYLNIDRFKQSIKSNTIDFIRHDSKYINSNPGELTNVVRALIAGKKYNLSFSSAVTSYIKLYLKDVEFSSIKQCELRHYKEEQLSDDQFKRILHQISFC